jgi:hypothetical protein
MAALANFYNKVCYTSDDGFECARATAHNIRYGTFNQVYSSKSHGLLKLENVSVELDPNGQARNKERDRKTVFQVLNGVEKVLVQCIGALGYAHPRALRYIALATNKYICCLACKYAFDCKGILTMLLLGQFYSLDVPCITKTKL